MGLVVVKLLDSSSSVSPSMRVVIAPLTASSASIVIEYPLDGWTRTVKGVHTATRANGVNGKVWAPEPVGPGAGAALGEPAFAAGPGAGCA